MQPSIWAYRAHPRRMKSCRDLGRHTQCHSEDSTFTIDRNFWRDSPILFQFSYKVQFHCVFWVPPVRNSWVLPTMVLSTWDRWWRRDWMLGHLVLPLESDSLSSICWATLQKSITSSRAANISCFINSGRSKSSGKSDWTVSARVFLYIFPERYCDTNFFLLLS